MSYRTVSLAHLCAMRTDTRPALVEAGRFDKAEIMKRAVAMARGTRRSMAMSWQRAMSFALTTVWGDAKRAAASQRTDLRIAASYRTAEAPTPVLEPRRAAPTWGRRPHVFLSGSHAHSHGW